MAAKGWFWVRNGCQLNNAYNNYQKTKELEYTSNKKS
jgi:hypothetical protein